MAAKPTLVLVQGAFLTPAFYAAFEARLRSHGFPVEHPVLPTCSDADAADFPSRTLSDDAAAVSRAVTALLDEGKTVVMLLHSYGGLVGNEAVTRVMSLAARREAGLRGGVAHLLHFAAFPPPVEGFSVLAAAGGKTPDGCDLKPDGRYYSMNQRERLFEDLSEEDAALWEGRTLPHSSKVHSYAITNCAWRYIPATMLIPTRDVTILAANQQAVAKVIGARVEMIEAGHMVMLSQSESFADRIAAEVDSLAL